MAQCTAHAQLSCDYTLPDLTPVAYILSLDAPFRRKTRSTHVSHHLHFTLVSASVFLKSFRRGIAPILGDGNCLFRAMSKLTYYSEDWHSLVRSILVEFISLNKDVFKELCSEDINDHIRNLKHLTTWGTHVEIKAASYLLNIPIYVCTQKDGNDEFYWEVFKPNCTSSRKQAGETGWSMAL